MDKTRFNMIYIFVALLGVLLLQNVLVRYQGVATIPYSDFQKLLRENKVAEVVISANEIRGQLKEPLAGGQRKFLTTRVETDLAGDLEKYGVKYSGRVESEWLSMLLSWIVPVLIFVGVWFFLTKRLAGLAGGGAREEQRAGTRGGRHRPASVCSSVVLPLPLAPRITQFSPGAKRKLRTPRW